MKSGFYYTNPERKNPIKNLKILFKPKITIKNPKNAIIIKTRIFGFFRVFGPGVACGDLTAASSGYHLLFSSHLSKSVAPQQTSVLKLLLSHLF